MTQMSVQDATDAIREDIATNKMVKADPAELHRVNFIKAVARNLGMEPTPETITHIGAVLTEHGIEPLIDNEYPKYVKRGYDGADVIAGSSEEEHEIVNATAPAPSDAGILTHPSDAEIFTPSDLDLKDKVPFVKSAEHPAGRASDEETNRAASQDTRPI